MHQLGKLALRLSGPAVHPAACQPVAAGGRVLGPAFRILGLNRLGRGCRLGNLQIHMPGAVLPLGAGHHRGLGLGAAQTTQGQRQGQQKCQHALLHIPHLTLFDFVTVSAIAISLVFDSISHFPTGFNTLSSGASAEISHQPSSRFCSTSRLCAVAPTSSGFSQIVR